MATLRTARALALGAALVSCAGPSRGPTAAKAARASGAQPLSDAEIRRVIGVVAAARQLPAQRSVAFERVSRDRFLHLLFEDEGVEPEGGLGPEAATLVGFDFVPPPEARAGLSDARDVLEEQVAGFYDHDKARIFVPLVPIASDGDALEQRAVIAHEAQHALQDQHFPAVLRDRGGGSDGKLARLALIEGDAMVAMGAYLGADHGIPVGRTIRRIADVTRKVPLERLRPTEHTTHLDRALALTRERMLFPYREGMLFVADVYRAGGFELVDRLYERPPSTTEQILHAEKYLAGEGSRPIAEPPTPPGTRRVADETLGELQIRALLSRCLRRDQAERAAAGWAGDRFVVAASERRALALGWVTAWDTERDAQEFEAALDEADGCWRDNRLGLDADDYTIAAGHAKLRTGAVVSFVRGLDGAPRKAWLDALGRLVGPAPKPVPVADVAIPPRVPLPEPTKGRLEGDEYRSAWLGISARIPAGLDASTTAAGLELAIGRADTLVRGALALSERVTNAEQNERAFEDAGRAFAETLGGAGLTAELASSGDAQTPLGRGLERTWRGVGTSVEMRMILVPICAGTGSVVLVTAYADPLAKGVLDGWVGSLRWINGRNVVACGYLDPK